MKRTIPIRASPRKPRFPGRGFRFSRSTKPFSTPDAVVPKPLPDTQQATTSRKDGMGKASMNLSIYSADKRTHLKVVVIALVAGIAVVGLGLSSRDSASTQTAGVIKAGKPTAITSSNVSVTR
jgi:hypothetical protein